MKTVIKDTDYVYASTRIRSSEGRGTFAERLSAYAEAGSAEELVALAFEWGVVPAEEKTGVTTPADAADAALRRAADLVRSSVPDPWLYDFLLYKYDCNNVKTAIKESVTGEHDPARYFRCGTVTPEAVEAAVTDRVFTALSENLGRRAAEAIDTFETTGEARAIDLLCDRGCFEDAAAAAGKTGVKFFREYVALTADEANFTTFARISSSGLASDAAAALTARAVVPGGTVSAETFESAASASDDHAERIAALTMRTENVGYREALNSSADPAAVASSFSKIGDELIGRYDFTAFGPEIPAVFFIKREAEIRSFRIAASMIAAGKTPDEIKGRIGLKV